MSQIDLEVEEEEARRAASMEEAMRADGVPTHERRQMSYFGFEERHTLTLPDDISWIEHQTLNEGARRRYLNEVNRDIRLQRSTGDAIMKMQAGDEKHALLESAIVGWNLVDESGNPVPFNKGNLQKFLSKASPKIVDLIEKDVRKHNAWLMAEMSVEDIQKQIDELEEMKAAKQRDEEGKVS